MNAFCLSFVFLFTMIAIFVFPSHPKKVIAFLFGMLIVISIAQLKAGPHYIVLEDRVPVRNNKPVMVWTHAKQYRNDRLFASSFQ